MKKKGPIIIIAIIGAIILVLGICGVGGYLVYKNFIADKVKEEIGDEMIEDALESATGGEAEVDSDDESVHIESDDMTMDIGSDEEWPDEIPGYVPEFKYGSIMGVTHSTTDEEDYWLISIEEVDSNAFSKYKSDIENNGWEVSYTQSSDSTDYLSASKGDNIIVFAVDTEDDTGSVTVTIRE